MLGSILRREIEFAQKNKEVKKYKRTVSERVKEQECLYKITSLNERNYTIEELLEEAVSALAEGFQYPDITEAEITFSDKVIRTSGFKNTQWELKTSVDITKADFIEVKVVYSEEKAKAYKGPFLFEEVRLVEAIANTLAQKVDHITINQELQHHEELLTEAYNVAEIGHWELDLESETLYWSNMVKKLHEVPLNYQPQLDEAIAFYFEEAQEQIKQLVDDAIENGVSYQTDLKIKTAKGNKRWVRSTGNAQMVDGNCRRLYGTTQDITKRKRMEERLRKSKQRYKSLFEDNHAAVILVDPKSKRIVDANQSALDFYGYSKSEMHEKPITDINKSETEELEAKLEEVAHKKQQRFEFQHQLADGSVRDVVAYASYVTIDNQELIYAYIFDDTEHQEATRSLRKLSKATEQSPALILITNTEGTIEYVNPKFAEVSEYEREELIGRNPRILKSGKQNNAFYEELWNTIKGGEVFKAEITNQKKSGEYYQVLVQIAPLFNDDGEITHFISVQEDITERKKNELKLQESLKEKEILLQEIHHRVKNNLAVVSGIMQLQAMDEQGRMKEKLRDNISRIQSMGTIHELLYQSDSFSEMSFSDAIKEVVETVRKQYEKQVEVSYDISPITLNVNQALPTALVVNEVVGNILKYAFEDVKSPKININFTVENGTVSLSITDNGQKLPDDFDPKKKNGSIGLQLINTLVAQLDGEYSYTSAAEGTQFDLTFEKAVVKGVGNAML